MLRRKPLILAALALGAVVLGFAAARWKANADHEREELVAWAAILDAEKESPVVINDARDFVALDIPPQPVSRNPLVLFRDGLLSLDGAPVPAGAFAANLHLAHEHVRQSNALLGGVDRFGVNLAATRTTRWGEIVTAWNVASSEGANSLAFIYAIRSRAAPPPPSPIDEKLRRIRAKGDSGREEFATLERRVFSFSCPGFLEECGGMLVSWDACPGWADRVRRCAAWSDFASMRAMLWALEKRTATSALGGASAAAVPAGPEHRESEVLVAFPADAKWEDIAEKAVTSLNAATGPVRLGIDMAGERGP